MSALTDRDTNSAPTSNPETKQNAGGEENKPQDSQQYKSMFEKRSLGGNECVEDTRSFEEIKRLTDRPKQQAIRLALRRDPEPSKPEALQFQAEADE